MAYVFRADDLEMWNYFCAPFVWVCSRSPSISYYGRCTTTTADRQGCPQQEMTGVADSVIWVFKRSKESPVHAASEFYVRKQRGIGRAIPRAVTQWPENTLRADYLNVGWGQSRALRIRDAAALEEMRGVVLRRRHSRGRHGHLETSKLEANENEIVLTKQNNAEKAKPTNKLIILFLSLSMTLVQP